MAKITLDFGHALSRLDQHRNRQQPYLISTGSSSYSFYGNRAAKFPKKMNTSEKQNFFEFLTGYLPMQLPPLTRPWNTSCRPAGTEIMKEKIAL
jgi:hypothetical protein